MPPRTEPELDLQRGGSAVYTLHAHLVFVTKFRRPVFTDSMLTFCEHLMREICAGGGAELREFNGQTDHVHLLVHYPPSLPISLLVNRLKGVSSRRLRQQYPAHVRKYLWGKHFWSVPLRRLLRWRTTRRRQAIHRTAEPTRLNATRYAGRTNGIGFLPAVKRPGFRRRWFGERIAG